LNFISFLRTTRFQTLNVTVIKWNKFLLKIKRYSKFFKNVCNNSLLCCLLRFHWFKTMVKLKLTKMENWYLYHLIESPRRQSISDNLTMNPLISDKVLILKKMDLYSTKAMNLVLYKAFKKTKLEVFKMSANTFEMQMKSWKRKFKTIFEKRQRQMA